MTRSLSRALCGTALAFVLLSFIAAPAFAQTITITSDITGDVRGNSPGGQGSPVDPVLPTVNSADGNHVIVNDGGQVTGLVFGGDVEPASGDASATNNSVTVNNGGTVTNNAIGGRATANDTGNATATNNSVTVNSGGSVTGSTIGGRADGWNSNATATGNTVIISGGTVRDVTGGEASYGEHGTTASGNIVTISGGTVVSGDVYGGAAYGSYIGGSNAAATGNIVNFSGGTARDVYGGYAQDDNAIASGNIVTISGGTVRDVYGGVTSGYIGSQAINNTVNISGGTVERRVVGGFEWFYGAPSSATNNTVNIMGTPDLTNATLYGGFVGNTGFDNPTPGMDARSGNTLNLHSPVTVASAQNFENWNFFLPSTMADGGTMLTIGAGGTADLGTDANVNVGIDGATSLLQVGNTVNLIDATEGALEGTLANSTANGQGMLGVTLKYEFDLLADTASGLLTATFTKVGVSEEAEVLPEGFTAGEALVAISAADLAAGPGIKDAVRATKEAKAKGADAGVTPTVAGFGALSAGSMRFKTGSHVDMKSLSLLAGLAVGRNFTPGYATLGAFFEYGTGSYDTYNSFSSGSIRGKGDTRYYGGGILGRMDFRNNIYTEASARTGRLHNEYNSSDLGASYDSSTSYYGFHLGTGYIWDINDKASLDIYGKYFWTRVEGDSVTLSTGDPVKFKNTESSRLRFGGRFAYAVNEFVSPYVGAAYEHEFDGKARATTNGYDIKAPSLRGSTGIGELGLSLTPSMNLPLSIDLGVQGYTGKREGVTGSLQIRFEF